MQLLLMQHETLLEAKLGNPAAALVDQIVIRYERMGLLTGSKVDGQHLEDILERARQRGDKHEIAYCLLALGDYDGLLPDFASQWRRYAQSVQLWREVGDDFFTAHGLQGLAMAYFGVNRSEDSINTLKESVRIR